MQQLVFAGKGKVESREAEDAALQGDGEALVRPLAVATCDIDAKVVDGSVPAQGPLPLGHEGVGEVTEVGDGVTDFVPGDLVSIPFQISCGECATCRSGHTGNCERVGRMATYGLPIGENYGGFLAESVRVPFADGMLLKVPEGLAPASIASLSDNIPDAWRTVGPPLEEAPGSAVLVCGGLGSIALYAVAIAKALGAERVDFAGGDARDRELAAELGAELLDEQFPERGGPYPIAVDHSGSREGLAFALRSTAPEGICTISAIYFEPETPVPLLEMYTKGIRVATGRVHARPAMERILPLITVGGFRPELITADTVSWDDAAEAIAGHTRKLVITR